MKFGFILNQDKNLIEVSRIRQPRFDLLLKITGINPKYLIPIEMNLTKSQIINEIDLLIAERETKPLDIPNYDGRFIEDEVFEFKNYKGNTLKLCKTGFDNLIIFLLNILEALEKGNSKLYFFFAKNHKELREFIDKGII
ncbi:MAG TPA: hypothetical protein VMW01_03845 [Williamwhitmania sp.]|nr:hypothetical protein [Williamwhitmania sp.]